MADYSINLYNSIDIFGGTPPSLWGVVQGNVDYWGYGSVKRVQYVGKAISNSVTPTDASYFRVSHLISETLTIDDLFAFNTRVSFSNSLSITDAMAEETLRDGNGYNYLFVSNKTDAEDRWQGTWANSDLGDVATYTTSSGSSTNWTQL